MALPAGFLEELRARTPLAAVIGRRVKLARSGRQLKGCCPFHGEKTPSFYVYDDHFHCFGCGAHGDAISFVMQSQGAGFMEAVEQLAAEAGMAVPKPSPEASVAERLRLDLYDVLARAETWFRRRLTLPEGGAALAYLRGRGLAEETIARFGLGWSGDGRGALIESFTRDGIDAGLLLQAGLLRQSESGELRELYYNRVMFPIRDASGRVISFGGRILGDGQPKYINGPETKLFAKRACLYGLDLARQAVREKARLVAVEGYMDVIALHQAGFGAAVAPLGTALTDDQLALMWRLSPVPVLCFDGDAAGGRAAARAAETALPLLAVDRSLQVAMLPAGDDPDSLVRRQGPAGFEAVLKNARPLADALFDLLGEGAPRTTPEQRAGFRARLEAAAARIGDRTLAAEYRRALLDRFYAAGGRRLKGKAAARLAAVPRPALPDPAAERLRILTAILLRHPSLLGAVGELFEQLKLPPHLARVGSAMLAWADRADVLDSSALLAHLTVCGLANEVAMALAMAPLPLPQSALAQARPAEAEQDWRHFFDLLHSEPIEEDKAAASRAFIRSGDDPAHRRLIALSEESLRLRGGELPADAEL
jgi:DNA primase